MKLKQQELERHNLYKRKKVEQYLRKNYKGLYHITNYVRNTNKEKLL